MFGVHRKNLLAISVGYSRYSSFARRIGVADSGKEEYHLFTGGAIGLPRAPLFADWYAGRVAKARGARDLDSPKSVLARIRALRRAAGDGDGAGVATPSIDALLRHTRPQLIEYARRIGLTGFHRLGKAALATRFRQEFERLALRARVPESTDGPRKFDLGPMIIEHDLPRDIPWGYGQDRVTAMAVDPEQLYVYWEVTDEALARAREGLGAGGGDAWLNLRIYDVTNRIFDGTNAHHYFDHSVARTDRQWFFFIGRASSTVIAEVGLKSKEGYFVRVARSGRADFPRRDMASPGRVEWLTVRSDRGAVGEPAVEDRAMPAVMSGGMGHAGQHDPLRVWDIRRTHGGLPADVMIHGESFRTAWEHGAWVREHSIAWEGPIVRTTWEAGPFHYPVETPRYVEERYEGPATVRAVDGGFHIVYGPWQVVIRGIGARAEQRVVAVWHVHRSWSASTNVTVRTVGQPESVRGASEQVALGASELYRRAASELRLGGASELYRMGASELRFVGASEWRFAGASEWRARGASERLYLGASEWQERGASETRFVGASERMYGGASERVPLGASENRPRYPEPPSHNG
jgi:hypothetical protein